MLCLNNMEDIIYYINIRNDDMIILNEILRVQQNHNQNDQYIWIELDGLGGYFRLMQLISGHMIVLDELIDRVIEKGLTEC